jgi:DNA-binding HxlR family transcriptional regulator
MESAYPISVLNAYCPSRKVLELLAEKWTILVFAAITRGHQRYNQLQREVGGISPKMLAQTLRGLERNGLISRTVYAVVPPMVEYVLTPLGETLLPVIHAMGEWAEGHYADVQLAREGFRPTGQPNGHGSSNVNE